VLRTHTHTHSHTRMKLSTEADVDSNQNHSWITTDSWPPRKEHKDGNETGWRQDPLSLAEKRDSEKEGWLSDRLCEKHCREPLDIWPDSNSSLTHTHTHHLYLFLSSNQCRPFQLTLCQLPLSFLTALSISLSTYCMFFLIKI